MGSTMTLLAIAVRPSNIRNRMLSRAVSVISIG